jgi:hypothetical protein
MKRKKEVAPVDPELSLSEQLLMDIRDSLSGNPRKV